MKLTKLNNKRQSAQLHKTLISDVVDGLSKPQKSIPTQYFYSDINAAELDKALQLPDSHLPEIELPILRDIASILPSIIDEPEIDIIELGVSAQYKSKVIIDCFLNQGSIVNFYPIDYSEKAINLVNENLTSNVNLTVHGLIGDHILGLSRIKKISRKRKLILFLDSNIGRLDASKVDALMKHLHASLNSGDYAIIGFDLDKNPKVLNQTSNNTKGVINSPYLNILTSINNMLGGNFNISKFQHSSTYNASSNALETHLISLEKQSIEIKAAKQSFQFNSREPVLVECAHKFTANSITTLAHANHFHVMQYFSGNQETFIDALLQAT